MLSQSPASLQLRYLQTLLELGADQNSTVVFPLPMDIIGPMMTRLAGDQAQASAPPAPAPAPDPEPVAEAPVTGAEEDVALASSPTT
jgi:hypothetical protein